MNQAINYGLIYLAWLGAILFPLVYGFTRPWWKTDMGRNLFAFSVVFALSLTLVAIRPVFGDFSWRPVLNTGLLVLIVVVEWWRNILFFRIGRKDRRSHNPKE